jgi:D-sedoheptulose 7-phosphate isomerase
MEGRPPRVGMKDLADRALLDLTTDFAAITGMGSVIASAAALMIGTLRCGGKILFCGNGGSAADSQHLAAELIGRYRHDRRPLPALALTVDTSALTAIANDYGFSEIFARQVQGLGQPGDLLVGISTSGNSANVLRALDVARSMAMHTIGLTGGDGGKMLPICDICIKVPSGRVNRIQEMHIAIGHILCGLVEDAVVEGELTPKPGARNEDT